MSFESLVVLHTSLVCCFLLVSRGIGIYQVVIIMPSASGASHSFADKSCINRLQKEYRALLRDPVPDIIAHPCEKSILEWHYVLKGSPESPYEGGVYHGKVVFPSEYPYVILLFFCFFFACWVVSWFFVWRYP